MTSSNNNNKFMTRRSKYSFER